MDQFRVNLSLLALMVCLAYVGWVAICVLLRRKQSTAFVLAEVLLACSLLVAAGANWFAAASFPQPSSSDLIVLLAIGMSVATRFCLGSFSRRTWNVAVAHALLVVAAAWNFHSSTLDTPSDLAFLKPPKKAAVDDAVLVTDQGRIFSLFRFDSDDTRFDENAQASFKDRIICVATGDLQSNCHGWVFTNGRYGIPPTAVAALLQDNGYSTVPSPAPGDVIVYRDGAGGIVHSGRVRAVHDDGQVWIESKWGPAGRYLHRPEDQCYSSTFSYYRSVRATDEAQIVQTPVTNDSRVARFNGAPLRRARG